MLKLLIINFTFVWATSRSIAAASTAFVLCEACKKWSFDKAESICSKVLLKVRFIHLLTSATLPDVFFSRKGCAASTEAQSSRNSLHCVDYSRCVRIYLAREKRSLLNKKRAANWKTCLQCQGTREYYKALLLHHVREYGNCDQQRHGYYRRMHRIRIAACSSDDSNG